MRLQVLIRERRIVVPIHDGLTIKGLLEETWRRTGLTADAGEIVLNDNGYELFAEDEVIPSSWFAKIHHIMFNTFACLSPPSL